MANEPGSAIPEIGSQDAPAGPRHRTEDPVATLSSTELGFRAVCTCGWKGSERDRMSDDYAWTNARDDVKSHERTHKKVKP